MQINSVLENEYGDSLHLSLCLISVQNGLLSQQHVQ